MTNPDTPLARRRARGRPKGTGIDDARHLDAIAGMLASDRSLKPTTAIKRVGVSDPSTIRRLREKLRATGEKIRIPAAALASHRSETLSADLPTAPQPVVAALPATPEGTAATPASHPPLAAETEKRTREALLLAAYLEAMVRSHPATEPAAQPAKHFGQSSPAQSSPAQSLNERFATPERHAPVQPSEPLSHAPTTNTAMGPASMKPPGAVAPPPETANPSSSGQPFTFPGMPPFLQPFHKPAPAAPAAASPTQQLEGMKLAVEAMTTMTKLQLHITENAFAYSPLAMMLQGQAMVGQMLLASFTGQLDAMKPKKPK